MTRPYTVTSPRKPNMSFEEVAEYALGKATKDEHGCLIPHYKKTKMRGGHPKIQYGGKAHILSRFILEYKLGRKIKPGLETLHRCENSRCINPDHLKEGTHSDNIRMSDTGRKLTEKQVRQIRGLYLKGKIKQRVLAVLYGISTSGVSQVVRRRSYSHIS